MLEERNQGRCHRHHLARGNVHVLDLVGGDEHGLAGAAAGTHQDHVLDELALGVERGVGLCDQALHFVIGGQVVDLLGDDTVD